MLPRFLTIALLSSTTIAMAEPHAWKNKEGTRAVRGDVISRDATSITIRRTSDFKTIKLPLDMIHPDDVAWLNANHPIGGAKPKLNAGPESRNDLKTISEALAYGDSYDTCMQKIKACKLVKANIAETLIGRTGMDGVFRTVNNFAGGKYELYFDWDESRKLKGFTFRSDALKAEELKDVIIPRWQQAVALATSLYGQPITSTPNLNLGAVQNERAHTTHAWKHPLRGVVAVSVGRLDQEYFLQFQFVNQEVSTNPTPAP